MTMLGAQLDDLAGLASRLRTTAGDIGDVQQRSTAATLRVVEEVRSAAAAAVNEVSQTMASLRTSVAASAAAAGSTTWSGLNRDRFLDAHQDFDRAMASAEDATTAAFADFGTAIEQMAAGIEAYNNGLSASLSQAGDASDSMATAVEQQRLNLDQVMNQGLGIG